MLRGQQISESQSGLDLEALTVAGWCRPIQFSAGDQMGFAAKRNAVAPLTDSEIADYRQCGQLTPGWRLAPDKLKRLQGSLERLLAARPSERPDFIALPHTPWDDTREGREIAREFFDTVSDPDLLDVIEALIGADIVLWASAMFCKPAGTGLEVPWHQDGQYWP
ncbi:MAG: phytanoyl-CoA dioxygenase family protein, partial [Gammaproteobacteria bacterium]